MAGNYEKCGKTSPRGREHWNTCNKKAGHKGEHADTKRIPVARWKDTEDA